MSSVPRAALKHSGSPSGSTSLPFHLCQIQGQGSELRHRRLDHREFVQTTVGAGQHHLDHLYSGSESEVILPQGMSGPSQHFNLAFSIRSCSLKSPGLQSNSA